MEQLGYSTLFKENDIDSDTASRFGCWLTAEFSLLLNGKSTTAKHNNYVNVLALGRYVEDGYNMNAQQCNLTPNTIAIGG